MPETDRKPSNPKDRIAINKLDLSLIPPVSIAYEALGYAEGDAKYGGYNWREAGVKASVYYAAFMRHMMKWWEGEWYDQTTGVPHLASAKTCLGIIIDAHHQGKLVDDRPPKTPRFSAFFDKELTEIMQQLYKLFPDGPERVVEAKWQNQ